MRTVVTGGAGFIGSHVVDLLIAGGHHVTVIDDFSSGREQNLAQHSANPALEIVKCDIASSETPSLVAAAQPEVIFHLAAQASVKVSVDNPLRDAEVNVLGTVNVLEGAKAANTRKIVYAASGGTLYGELSADELPAKESYARQPVSPYGISKAVAIDYLSFYKRNYDIDFTALGLANIYGPRQDPHGEAGVVAIFSKLLRDSAVCTINGDGEQTRDYVFVGDVARAFVAASNDQGNGKVINIGRGEETSVNELYQCLSVIANSNLAPNYGPPRQGDVRRSSLDPSLAASEISWRPEVDLKQGLAETFASLA